MDAIVYNLETQSHVDGQPLGEELVTADEARPLDGELEAA